MLLSALVIDTNDFPNTGKIKVRISKEYSGGPMTWDMKDNPAMALEGYDEFTGFSGDKDVYVMSPFGVGKNCSLFWLPRVNSKGLVSPLGSEQSREFVWIGGYFDKVSDSFYKSHISTPSQNFDDDNGFSSPYENKNAFVFRTKTTDMVQDRTALKNNTEAANGFLWDKNFTENMIVIDEEKIQIRHFSKYDENGNNLAYQDIYIGTKIKEWNENGTVKSKEDIVKVEIRNNEESNKERINTFTLSDTGTLIQFQDVGKDGLQTITIDSLSIKTSSTVKEKTSTYFQKGENVTITGTDATILVEKEKVSLVAKNVYITAASEIHLGDGKLKVVTTSSPLPNFKLPDGTILTVSSKVFG